LLRIDQARRNARRLDLLENLYRPAIARSYGRRLKEYVMLAVSDPSVLKSDYVLPPDYEIMTETAEVFTKALLLGMEPEQNNFADDVDVLPFEEALAYMRKRLPVDGKTYYALADKMRYRAFTVSRLADGDAVRHVQSMLVKAMDEGSGIQQFLQLTEGQLADAAGMGKGAGWYYETVYRTNTATAYNVGRAIGFEETPPVALELIGIDDARQTEICHSLTVPPFRKPYDDPVWEHLWPPFHFNCRTTVRAIYDESEIEDAGGPDKFYTQGTPDYTPDKGFGTYPLDKSDAWWDLTDAMKARTDEYGLAKEFEDAKEKLVENRYSDKIKELTGMDSISLSNIPDDVQEGIYKGFENIMERFPQLKGEIISLDDFETDPKAYASCIAEKSSISLNKEFFGSLEKIVSTYNSDVEKGFHPAGTDWRASVAHEFGHRLNSILDQKFAAKLVTYGSGYNMDVHIREDALDNLELNVRDIAAELSVYAAYNTREFFAEAFAEYINSENPRRLAKEVGRMIELALRGIFP
jgi:SPP1 gp7 family putative phage head morphogenesis protein